MSVMSLCRLGHRFLEWIVLLSLWPYVNPYDVL